MNPSSFRRQTTLVKENADEGSPFERKKRRIGDKLKVYQGPHEFLRSSSINDLPCTIENILNKNQRSDEDVAFLYEHVKNYKFLQEIVESSDIKEKHRIISFLCKKFQCEHYEAGNVIIKQGEVSNKKVYLILSGRAQVRIQSNNGVKNEEPILKKEDSHKTSSTKTKILTKFSFSKFDLNSKRNSISIENKDSLFFQQAREDFARTPSKYPSSKTRLRTRTESKKTTMNCEDILHQKFDSVLTPITPLAMTPMTLSPLTNFKLEPVDESEFKNAHLYGKVINELIEKDNFGEQALFSQSKRKTTVIAITDLTLITFEQQDYQGAYKEINQTKQDISQSLVKVLPSLNSPENARILDGIVSITDFCDCSYGKKLAIEGEIGDEFFLIVQGQCELIKTVIYDKSERLKGINSLYAFTKTTKEEVIISNVEKGTLIGEEILFGNKGIYKFTVRVNSETAQLITFKKSLFLFRCNKHILKELEEYSSQKNTRNIENLSIR